MLKKILFSLALGIVATVYIAQNDTWVHDAVRAKLKVALESAWNCSIDFEVDSVNIFVPSVTLKNVQVRPYDLIQQEQKTWWWQAKSVTLSTSWLTWGLSSMIGLHVQVEKVQGSTLNKGTYIPIIHDHIFTMMSGTSVDIPLYLKTLAFHDATINVHNPENKTDINLRWSSESKSINGVYKTNISLLDGSAAIADRSLLKQMQGDLALNIAYTPHGMQVDCHADCTGDVQLLDTGKQKCFIKGDWLNKSGNFTILAADKTMAITPLHIKKDAQGITLSAQATIPARVALNFLKDNKSYDQLSGDCALDISAEFDAQHSKIVGSVETKQLRYGSLLVVDEGKTSFNYTPDGVWNGSLSVSRAPFDALQGVWQWNSHKDEGSCTMHNAQQIEVPGFEKWVLKANDLAINITVDAARTLNGGYTSTVTNTITHALMKSKGKICFQDSLFTSAGHINQSTYECALHCDEAITLKKLVYKNSTGVALLDLHRASYDSSSFEGVLEFSLLRSLAQQLFKYDVQGEGRLALSGSMQGSALHIKTELKDGIIRLPETYNFINACNASIIVDAAHKSIVIHDLYCGLHRGSLKGERIIIQADDAYSLQYAFAPFTFESCLLNIKKDLFALFSGTVAISKKQNQLPHIKSNIIIERSYLKENIYSEAFQKSLLSLTGIMIDADKQDATCDITVESKEPIRVDTAFLEASAKVALHITNTVRNPKLSGSVEIISGSLNFPYKPLMISKGTIYFMPDQLFDPLIELVAKTKIKKYSVGLQVSGSLLNHHISLSSSPPLSDEQIIALLLVGSQEQSLNMVVPALLMQNLKSLLFDSEQSPLHLNKVFSSWLRPFKNIHLVPSFSDQTGRGGLRGAIEIEISDRWRAMAQKNFSLSEDTRFEVEYSLSDDITLRGIRNERKDVAAEVEMRWKFGS